MKPIYLDGGYSRDEIQTLECPDCQIEWEPQQSKTCPSCGSAGPLNAKISERTVCYQNTGRKCQAFTHAHVDARCDEPAVGEYRVKVTASDGVYEDMAWLCEEHNTLSEGPISVVDADNDESMTDSEKFEIRERDLEPGGEAKIVVNVVEPSSNVETVATLMIASPGLFELRRVSEKD